MKKQYHDYLDNNIVELLRSGDIPKSRKAIMVKVASNIKRAKFPMKNISRSQINLPKDEHRDGTTFKPIFPRILCDDFEIEILKSGRWYQILFEGKPEKIEKHRDGSTSITCNKDNYKYNLESCALTGYTWDKKGNPEGYYLRWNLTQVKFLLNYVYKIPKEIVNTFKHNGWYPNSCG